MTPTWRQIRALNYGTIGRTVHAVARYANSDTVEELWFDPPNSWRTERDGVPTTIESATDEYRRTPDGMVHTSRTDGVMRLTAYAGAYSKSLFSAHHNWPMPGAFGGHGALGEPERITETHVHDRRGWRVDLAATDHQSAQSFTIDADSGVVIAWRSGSDSVELVSHTLDEVFDPALFTWDGDVIEHDDEMARLRSDHEEKQRRIAEIPLSEPRWFPSTINVSPSDGDPDTGSLDMNISVQGPNVSLRRWLTGADEPAASLYAGFHSASIRVAAATWTHELSYSPEGLTHEEAERILASIPRVEPPRPAAEIVGEIEKHRADQALALVTPGTVDSIGVIYTGPVNVSYHQYYLQSDEIGAGYNEAFAGQRNGLIGTQDPVQVILTSGLHTGNITVSLEIADARPDVDTTAWEEIVEAPLTISSQLCLCGWGDANPGTVLPIPRGTYRIRYCANNMDAAYDADTGEDIDSYLITVWPSELMPDEIIKQTSKAAGYSNDRTHK